MHSTVVYFKLIFSGGIFMPHISMLDPKAELPVDQTTWVVAILRKPHGAHSEHVFLMVEGETTDNQVIFKHYHLSRQGKYNPDSPDYRHFKVVIKEDKRSHDQAVAALLKDFFRDEAVVGKVWSIPKSGAKTLHAHVEASQAAPGEYNLFGLEAIVPKSAAFSQAISGGLTEAASTTSKKVVKGALGQQAGVLMEEAFSPPGHNWFTWARWQLFQLENRMIQENLPQKWSDMAESITDRYLQRNAQVEEPSSGNCRIC
jgi:hypothetical protein